MVFDARPDPPDTIWIIPEPVIAKWGKLAKKMDGRMLSPGYARNLSKNPEVHVNLVFDGDRLPDQAEMFRGIFIGHKMLKRLKRFTVSIELDRKYHEDEWLAATRFREMSGQMPRVPHPDTLPKLRPIHLTEGEGEGKW